MRISRHRHKRQMSEINVVPYIDVMLVLLIIFMVTAPLLSQGVKVDLPQASSAPLPPNEKEPNAKSLNCGVDTTFLMVFVTLEKEIFTFG